MKGLSLTARTGLIIIGTALLITGCDNDKPWNDPHVDPDMADNSLHTTFNTPPKTLDPARSYTTNEHRFTGLIYEPPLQYDPGTDQYKLIPRTAAKLPDIEYLDSDKQPIPKEKAEQAAYTAYTITIQPGICYQPHPAFAKDEQGQLINLSLAPDTIASYDEVSEFKNKGTRELTARDYVYEIKRLADPQLGSPIYGLMSQHIVGFDELNDRLTKLRQNNAQKQLDLRDFKLEGVQTLNRYQFRVLLKGRYRQFRYWLAMPFFAPVPWEAVQFYNQPGMDKQNFNLDWQPVGTGPYMLTENNPNLRMVLTANPHYHRPDLLNQNKTQKDHTDGPPYIQQIVFHLEKENIPRWNKFLQGYYDQSGVSSDSFNQAIQIDQQGKAHLTKDMKQQGIQLQTTVEPAIFYFGFNMLDPVVGGYDESSRKLRQAIAIALDFSEYVSIFLNGRGQPAYSPLPPSIFGHLPKQIGFDPTIYKQQNGEIKRRSLKKARQLLAEAGYPDGIDPDTGEPLVLHYDAISTGDPGQKAIYDWMRQKFAKLGISLQVEATQYNRFQQKIHNGNAQMFSFGWQADYPDPENFLFLFYGPNGEVKHGGANSVNYHNPQYDRLFEKMRNMPDNDKRHKLIRQMIDILHKDQPWIWGYYAKSFLLSHQWMNLVPLNSFVNNRWQYLRLNPQLRQQKQSLWNRPVTWPLWLLLGILLAVIVPALVRYGYRLRHTKRDKS